MNNNKRGILALAALLAVLAFAQGAALAQENSPLMLDNGVTRVHILPTIQHRTQLGTLSDTGPLLYHNSGTAPVMTSPKVYAIFWLPTSAKLQDGITSTTLPTHYQTVVKNFFGDYPSHTLASNNTQYFQVLGTAKTFIKGTGSFGGAVVDTDAYPTSGCTDAATPGNCITDAQLQAEIQNVITAKGWVPNVNTIFFLFTSSSEGSCFDSTNQSCAFVQYCAYHGAFTNGLNQTVIYANMPFLNVNGCLAPHTPNNDIAADSAASVASHELTEAITDPELNAWFTSLGNEIGDLCNFNFGTNTWDSALANQMWNGRFYELQQEWDNHKSSCQQLGP